MNTATLVTDYFMTDALGSVRQLTDAQGEITLANAYEPYGVLAQTAGSAQTSYGFTGEFTDPSGMVYLRARYCMPNDGRFLTRDTWDGDVNLPSTLPSSPQPPAVPPASPSVPNIPPPAQTPAPFVPPPPVTSTSILDQIFATPCPTPSLWPIGTLFPIPLDSELASYGVTLNGNLTEWTSSRVVAVKEAVRAVATKLAATVGRDDPITVFRGVYGYINITWGLSNATGQCNTINVGGCTSSRHQINFVRISDDSLRARNNVVHELGHAFSNYWSNSQSDADRLYPENTHPGIVLGWTQSDYPAYTEYVIAGFPNRADPVPNVDGTYPQGDYLGFASRQNVLTWQVAMTQAGSSTEEFADQFLGWTFDTWQSPDGVNNYGALRRDWMDRYMPGWINRILRG